MSQIKPRKITIAEMAPHVHSFLPNENKVDKIVGWLIEWINVSLSNGKIMPNDYLPSKGEFAFHIGVSIGTMQNVYRKLEDLGLVVSKQRIGTCINSSNNIFVEKLTSKREVVTEQIKQYLIDNHYKVGEHLISTRKLAELLGTSNSTVRVAVNSLVSEGILEKQGKIFSIIKIDYESEMSQTMTLVDKIADHINSYIKTNLKPGDKLPSSNALADMYNVSIKTIHDAVKILSLAGIVKTKRGYYGTIVANSDEDDSLYFYEQVQLKIKKYIKENCKVNDKLPSIKDFSEIFNVSTKTIKKALDNLAYEYYVTFVRGRYGGTFVTEIPAEEESGYTWLALSSEFETKK